MSVRYFRYCTWDEMNTTLASGGLPPYSNSAADLYILEITKEEAVLIELKNELKKKKPNV